MRLLYHCCVVLFVTLSLGLSSTPAHAIGNAYCEMAVVVQKLAKDGSMHKEFRGRVVDLIPKKAWGGVMCPVVGERVWVSMDVPIFFVDEGDVIWFSYSYHKSRFGTDDREKWIPHFSARIGCGCSTAPAAPSSAPLAMVLLALFVRVRRSS